MDTYMNFLDFFVIDIVLCILSLLDDPADIVRASVVSHSWRHYIISNGLSKKLCLRKAPTLTNVTSMVEKRDAALVMCSDTMSWEAFEREHKMYTSFLHALSKSTISPKQCIECIIGASSINHPEESVLHILIEGTLSCWSSNEQSDPNVPESIIVKLNSRVCIVNEIDIRPFEANWENGGHVYSATSVRFRMGHPRSSKDFKFSVKSLPL